MRVTRHGVLCTSSPRPPLGGRPLWQRPPSSSEVLMAHPRADLFHVSRADLFGDLRPNLLSSDPREGFEFFFRQEDRKSVVSGKSVSVRVDLGGRRIITKKKQNNEGSEWNIEQIGVLEDKEMSDILTMSRESKK